MREKPVLAKSLADGAGITPACAGKTLRQNADLTIFRDHPRVCGKNAIRVSEAYLGLGSPPRVREKPGLRLWFHANGRITPACAGKTLFGLYLGFIAWDHPRVCGKNQIENNDQQDDLGSPPRVREKR